MTCPECGRYADPDPSTGYDGADLCPDCALQAVEDGQQRQTDDWDLEQSVEHLSKTVDRHVGRIKQISNVLSTFYRAPLSASSVQAVLALAVELNPTLRTPPSPSTLVRRHLVCACGQRHDLDGRVGDADIPVTCSCGLPRMRVDSIELLPSPAVDVLTSEASPF